jgi:hypothetical protein
VEQPRKPINGSKIKKTGPSFLPTFLPLFYDVFPSFLDVPPPSFLPSFIPAFLPSSVLQQPRSQIDNINGSYKKSKSATGNKKKPKPVRTR